MEAHEIELPSKPGAKLRIQTYTRSPLQDGSLPTLAVFLNGLMSPQSTWNPALDILLSQLDSPPSILTYDRYGQGDSDPDPSDPPDTVYGHDARCVVVDLHELIAKVCTSILHLPPPGPNLRLVFVANSIGCPLSRLYAAAHPGTISGFIFLDSMMANTDFVSLFPDPDAPDFDSDSLPSDISVDDIRHARQEYHKMFRPSVPNHEHLDRRNLRELLPHAEKPKLPRGPDGKSPLLTVVGHDWEVFATQSLEGKMAIPKPVTHTYVNTAWHRYNQDLCQLTSRGEEEQGPVIAAGCGHFVQKDDPAFVAREIMVMLDRLDGGRDEPAYQIKARNLISMSRGCC